MPAVTVFKARKAQMRARARARARRVRRAAARWHITAARVLSRRRVYDDPAPQASCRRSARSAPGTSASCRSETDPCRQLGPAINIKAMLSAMVRCEVPKA